MMFFRLLRKTAVPLTSAALLTFPAMASALEVGVKVEPGVAVPLTTPQTPRFDPGGEVSLKAYLGLGRYFDAQAGVSFLSLPAASGVVPSSAGTAWSDSLGLRFQRPHDAAIDRSAFAAASPWVDADALYVRTGPLDRFGYTVGAGVSFPLGQRRNTWLGPFVRYMQIVQPNDAGFADGDARMLFVGASLEFGTSPLPRVVQPDVVVECPYCAPVVVVLPDRDHDTVPDTVDLCPDAPGPVSNGGCPLYKRITVRSDRLELSEKIMFAWDKADIEDVSLPLLDEVVQALKDNKGFRVQMEGHTDSTGPQEHNQKLSEERAEAVLAYLRNHGIAANRLSSKGFGSTEPTDSNATALGRENNRRVDFVIQFKILDRSVQ
jgi:outer membrane protein OmpA-like peptidoglycan-associated protein